MPGRTGRRPLPTALKLLKGETRPSRVNRNEPRPPLGARPPAWMLPSARMEWDRLCPLLEASGVLTVLDADALAIYCHILTALRAVILEGGKVDPRSLAELRQWQAALGMTPATRGRVQAVPPEPPGRFKRYLPPRDAS